MRRFDLIERLIRGSHQGLGMGLANFTQVGDTDRKSWRMLNAESLPEVVAQRGNAIGQCAARLRGTSFEDDHKFVAATAKRHIALSNRRSNDLRQRFEHLIASRVAEGVGA